MNDQPLFSILIAQYNNGIFFKECYDSIIEQTYSNFEVIIVDDCSTDDSLKIIEELIKDDFRFKIYKNDENKGCGYTKRRCAELATGEICGFLDPDDALTNDALESSITAHLKYPNASIISSRWYGCNEKMEILYESRLLKFKENKSYLETRDYTPEHFTSFKKYLYDKTQGINPNYPLGVDQDLNFLLEEVGDWYVLDKVIYKYRIHREGISKNYKSLYWNIIIRHNACIRRGINPNEYSVKDFGDLMENYEKGLKKMEEIYQSRLFKLARFVLKPIKSLRGK